MHTERCRSLNYIGSGEDFYCVCRDESPLSDGRDVPQILNGERPAELLIADIAQIAFTECQDPLDALARIRGLIDPNRASCLPPELQK